MKDLEIVDAYKIGSLSKYQIKLIELIAFAITSNNLYALGKLEIIYPSHCKAAQILYTEGYYNDKL